MPPSRIAGIVVCDLEIIVPAGIQLQFVMFNEIGGELHQMDHLGGLGVLKDGTGDGRFGNFQEIRRSVPGIHILIQNPPHMPAFAADDDI